jgi:hypothetical protein
MLRPVASEVILGDPDVQIIGGALPGIALRSAAYIRGKYLVYHLFQTKTICQ